MAALHQRRWWTAPSHASGPTVNPPLAIAFKIVSTFLFTLMLVCVKAVSGEIPPGQIVFARSAFALIPIIAMLAWQGEMREALRTERPAMHVGRAVFGVAAMALWFSAVGILPLPEALAISYAAPVIVVVLAALILHEAVRLYRWGAVIVGFIGIIVILSPHLTAGGAAAGSRPLGALLALGSTLMMAIVVILVRQMTRTETTGSIVFWFSIMASLVSLLTLPFGWTVPDWEQAAILVAAGLLGGIGQLFLTQSFRYGEASTVAPFEYASMIWGVALGWLLFGELPQAATILGGSILIAAGIFIIWREHRLGLERTRQRKVQPLQG